MLMSVSPRWRLFPVLVAVDDSRFCMHFQFDFFLHVVVNENLFMVVLKMAECVRVRQFLATDDRCQHRGGLI
jgi:hypothetical protein